jgi:TonB-linked SusC/RagA family outer membrane protein
LPSANIFLDLLLKMKEDRAPAPEKIYPYLLLVLQKALSSGQPNQSSIFLKTQLRLYMKRKIYLSLIACFSFVLVWGQNRQVTGRVISDSSNAIAGVNVTVKGTATTVATNDQGQFTISIPDKSNVVLTFSSVGYATQDVAVGSRSVINITLSSVSSSLNDVVVIGYQTVRRKDLLASVSSVSAKELKDIPINSAAEALNGRLAGVTATTSEGSPDATIRIRVRGGMSITGDNNPLFIVDGVQVENALNTLSPQDILSIDVLKDAAATAIYGARGGNGVIVITTKSGRSGRTIVSYNGFVGVKSLARELDVLSPYDFVIYQSERSRGSGTDSTNFTKNFGTTWDTLNVYKNIAPIDWQKEVFGNTGITTTHNVNVTGGNKKITYNFGYTFNDDKAIVLNSNYLRHLLNLKGDYKVTKNLKVGLSGRLLHQDVEGAGVSSDQGSQFNRLRNAVKYRPFLSPNQGIDDQDPLSDPNVGNGLNLYNPITLADAEFRNKTTDAYNVTAFANYNILKNLVFRSTFGYDHNQFYDRQFYDSITPLAIINGARKPFVTLDTVNRNTITNSNTLTWSLKDLGGKSDLDVLIGEETYELRTETHSTQFRNYPLNTASGDAIKNTTLGTVVTGYPKTFKSRYTSLSFFGRVNYSLLDRYLFSFNLRADGASKFAPGKQWGYFPAASFAWRVSKESFLKDVDFINDLKFRVGFGTVGNNRINDYLFLTQFSSDGKYYYGINGQSVIAYYPTALVNPDLQWESTVNRNIGVDFNFYKNRFQLSFDYYDNSSKDLLLNVPIASTYGYTTQFQNIGKTNNRGVEFQLNAAIIQKKTFTWSANFNISHNENKVEQLGVNQTQFFPPTVWGVSGQPSDYLVKVGQPVGVIWGLVTDGFYKVSDFDYNPATLTYTLKAGVVSDAAIIGTVQPGAIKFKDLNNDGVVDLNNDRQIIGNTQPKLTGGLNQQFTYKNFDASIFVNFSYGGDIYNANKIEMTNGYSTNSNMLAVMEGRWKVVTATGQTAQWVNGSGTVFGIDPAALASLNQNATIWQPIKGAGAFYPHSWAIEDGSFIRLNNLTVGYTFPVRSIAGIHMSKLRLYVTANNLAIITNYSGYDPEVSVRNNPLTPGLDYSAYPKSRTFIFGVNASF